ncbi:hypothetical protein NC653_034496 [Populus alba x Populus x berolinensis]|uniref:Uncharacterized protein n=1 Tax=Populus alba x Populus x berolinensis TaxID=444605 RepID=A0AAD6LQJ7_9ROSI|nr:hypothetical protein NC653_034496 [Populus alba x Populus x berolinensis]
MSLNSSKLRINYKKNYHEILKNIYKKRKKQGRYHGRSEKLKQNPAEFLLVTTKRRPKPP